MQHLPKKVRSKKLGPKIDLTAMVSVSFLLIIFFMVATELAKPKILDLSMPSCGDTCGLRSCGENRSVTILLDDNNKLIVYIGLLAYPIMAPKELNYGKAGIRKELLIRNKSMLEYSSHRGKPGIGITVIIKPTKKSNYGNLVDILDEMKITGISSYAIANDFTPEETKLLASN